MKPQMPQQVQEKVNFNKGYSKLLLKKMNHKILINNKYKKFNNNYNKQKVLKIIKKCNKN